MLNFLKEQWLRCFNQAIFYLLTNFPLLLLDKHLLFICLLSLALFKKAHVHSESAICWGDNTLHVVRLCIQHCCYGVEEELEVSIRYECWLFPDHLL